MIRLDSAARFGLFMVAAAALIYWLSAKNFDATRGDFFYLADAFLHGRVWLDVRLGYQDVILRDGHLYVPFAPFPAIALMPIVWVFGPVVAVEIHGQNQGRKLHGVPLRKRGRLFARWRVAFLKLG